MKLKKLATKLGIVALSIFVLFAFMIAQIDFNSILSAKIFIITIFVSEALLVISVIALSKLASRQDDYYSAPTSVKKKS